MQLFLILLIFLLGGKSGSQKILNEVVPVLESLGDRDLSANLKQAVKSAEELSAYAEVLGAFSKSARPNSNAQERVTARPAPIATEPLKPITAIAPPDVMHALAGCI